VLFSSATAHRLKVGRFTRTVNAHAAVCPLAAVAVQVTVVVCPAAPLGKKEPEGGTHATVTPAQLSVAVGAG